MKKNDGLLVSFLILWALGIALAHFGGSDVSFRYAMGVGLVAVALMFCWVFEVVRGR